ncbi:MAG TPA: hypothetical protein VGC04_05435 [Cellulomonas sp.]
MLVAAALVPDSALLVPGAGGVADPGSSLRQAALMATWEAVHGECRVVVVAPGPRDRRLGAAARASLGAAGVPDEALAWRTPAQLPDRPARSETGPVAGVSASVALFLLAQHHVAAAEVVEVDTLQHDVGRAGQLRVLGRRLADEGPTALVVVGSASARHGPDAPLADDHRAPGYDDALLGDLADGTAQARARLAALDPELAAELAVTGWAPWQVLLGAAGEDEFDARLVQRGVLAGASHATVTWRRPVPTEPSR